MKLPIGKVIYELRKDMSVTQEQLASSVGVSVPAVSRWESGHAYPDITLLPSIARYFNTTIDRLMNYEIELSAEEVQKVLAGCAQIVEQEGLEEGVAAVERYLYQYPNNLLLKLQMAVLYINYFKLAKDGPTLEELVLKAIRLLELAAQSEEIQISQSANYLLGSLYAFVNESEKAEMALSRIPSKPVNPEDLLVPLYMQQGRFTEAKKILQTNMYSRLMHINQALRSFSHIAVEEGNMGLAEELLTLEAALVKLFDLGSSAYIRNQTELSRYYARCDRKEEALASVEAALSALKDLTLTEFVQDRFFNPFFAYAEKTGAAQSPDQIKVWLHKALERNREYDFLREDQRFQDILNQLQTIWSR